MKKALLLLLCAIVLQTGLVGCDNAQSNKDVPLDTILQNIRDAYGGDYIPDSDIPENLLTDVYGLTADMYVDIRAEMAMISTFPDTVLVVKAAEDQADNVEAALTTDKDNAISNTLQYPMNIPKTNATQVVRSGDYVAFLMVGAVGEFDDAQSEEAMRFARDETQKAVKAFEDSFQ